jgi:alkylation response protein AidB-like acyl-CoA dehydrogenase
LDFAFGEEQELLRASTRRYLQTHQSLDQLRAVIESAETFDAHVWRKGSELGWAAMLVPESEGGGSVTDQAVVDLVVLAEEHGRVLSPGALLGTNVVADAVSNFGSDGQRKEHLPSIANGERVAAWCFTADGSCDISEIGVTATPEKSGIRLDGLSRYVHCAAVAGLLLVSARRPDGSLVNVLVEQPSNGISIRTLEGLDITRRFAEVRFDGMVVPETAMLEDADALVERALALAVVIQSAEAVGAADHLFESTVQYTKDRIQFGRPIGSFQAIKHRLADLLIELEAMRAATHYAALALSDGYPDSAAAVATAGAFVCDTFAHLCGESLQIHGGIGFTWEHDVHLFLRRAKVDQALFGNAAWHRERLCSITEQQA